MFRTISEPDHFVRETTANDRDVCFYRFFFNVCFCATRCMFSIVAIILRCTIVLLARVRKTTENVIVVFVRNNWDDGALRFCGTFDMISRRAFGLGGDYRRTYPTAYFFVGRCFRHRFVRIERINGIVKNIKHNYLYTYIYSRNGRFLITSSRNPRVVCTLSEQRGLPISIDFIYTRYETFNQSINLIVID